MHTYIYIYIHIHLHYNHGICTNCGKYHPHKEPTSTSARAWVMLSKLPWTSARAAVFMAPGLVKGGAKLQNWRGGAAWKWVQTGVVKWVLRIR